MKLLFVVIAAFVAVNAAPSNNVKVSDLLKAAKGILFITKTLERDIDSLLAVTNNVLKVSERVVDDISVTVARNYEVAEVTDTIGQTGKCQNVFELEVGKFEKRLEDFVKKTVDSQTIALKDVLVDMKKNLEKIEEKLSQNLDTELETCNNDHNTCSITGDYVNLTRRLFAVLGISSMHTNAYQSILEIENNIISREVGDAVIKPVQACLNA